MRTGYAVDATVIASCVFFLPPLCTIACVWLRQLHNQFMRIDIILLIFCLMSAPVWGRLLGTPNRNAKSSPQQMTNNVVAQAWKALSTSKWMRHDYGVDNVYLRLQNGCSNSVWRVEFARKNYDGFGGGVCVYIDAKSFEVLGMRGTK